MNYSDDEIQEVVSALLRTEVRTPVDSLGVRQIDVGFDQAREAAIGVFLLYFNAPFYIAYLASRQVLELIEDEAELLDTLLDALPVLGRLVTPVSDLTAMANARAALGELSAAVTDRDAGFSDIETAPAFRRYARSVNSFLSSYGRNIKKGGSVVSTPQQAKVDIGTGIATLAGMHSELVRRVGLLANAVADLNALQLPKIAAMSVIGRARDALDSRLTQLEGLDEVSRLEFLRTTVLELLSQKAVVQKYGGGLAPSPYFSVSGTGEAYVDANHPGKPPAVPSDIAGPYAVLDGANTLSITINGALPTELPLPLSYVAELTSSIAEPYIITTDVNDEVKLEIEGIVYTCPLTVGTRAASDVATDVMGIIGTTSATMEAVYFPLRLDTLMSVISTGGTTAKIEVIAGDLSQFGIIVGDVARIKSGANIGTEWSVTLVYSNGIEVAGGVTAVDDLAALVEIGASAKSLRFFDNDNPTAVVERRTIRIVGGDPVSDSAATTLGFFPGVFARSSPTITSDLVTAVNSFVSTVKASSELVDAFSGRASTVTSDPTSVVVYRGHGVGDIVSTGTGFNVVNRSILDGIDGVVGDKFRLLSDPINTWTITEVSTSALVCSGPAVASGSNHEFEYGPQSSSDFGWVLQITSGPNTGNYVISEPSPNGVSHLLDRPLPIVSTGGAAIRFDATLARDRLVIGATNTEQKSSISIDGLGAGVFFNVHPVAKDGETTFIQLTGLPKGLKIGDFLELREEQLNVVTRSLPITSIDTLSNVISTDAVLPNTFSVSFDLDTVPAARLRAGEVADFDSLKSGLVEWLDNREGSSLFFKNLNAKLARILNTSNPISADINDVINDLRSLYSILTNAAASSFGSDGDVALEGVLLSYKAPVVDAIDALLTSYKERGADRAVALLLECRFSDFFNVPVQESSYAGVVSKSIQDVAREDMPIRKTDRETSEHLLAQSESIDYEFDTSDSDSGTAPSS